MTTYKALANTLAEIAMRADAAAKSVENLDHTEDFPYPIEEMKDRAALDIGVLLDVLDMPGEHTATMADLDSRNKRVNTPPASDGMRSHPALQPVLRRADVARLLGSLEAARAGHVNMADHFRATDRTTTYTSAVSAARATASAYERVKQAWEAAVIAADAANTNLTKEERPE